MALTVLVVDDHAETCRLIQRVLTPEGYTVATAPDGEAALVAVAAERPALVIADVFLPELDGLALMRRLRAGDPHLPIIAMSAAGDALTRLESDSVELHLGGVLFLAKPFTVATLIALVHRLLPE